MNAEERARPVVFFDTNVLLYLIGDDARKTAAAANALSTDKHECVVSAQILSEFVNVLRKKARAPWNEIREHLTRIHLLCRVEPGTDATVQDALSISERGGFAWYDAVVIAAALSAGATRLLTEDMQDGRKMGRLTIVNPFGGKTMGTR